MFSLKLKVLCGSDFFECLAKAKTLAAELGVCIEFDHTYVKLLRKDDDGSVFVKPDGTAIY